VYTIANRKLDSERERKLNRVNKRWRKAILSRLLIKDNDDDLFHYAAAAVAVPFCTKKHKNISG
jgi:hypothetical protein